MAHLRLAFTLIELLVVVVIIAILAVMIIGGVGVLRERTRRHEARQVVEQLVLAIETYQSGDQRRHHYPLQEQLYPNPTISVPQVFALTAQGGAPAGVFALLVDLDVSMRGSGALRDGILCDPWGRPYLYQLTRPAPTSPVAALQDWNWDAVAGRSKARNRTTTPDSDAPYPYVWSLGGAGKTNDAAAWIYHADSLP